MSSHDDKISAFIYEYLLKLDKTLAQVFKKKTKAVSIIIISYSHTCFLASVEISHIIAINIFYTIDLKFV